MAAGHPTVPFPRRPLAADRHPVQVRCIRRQGNVSRGVRQRRRPAAVTGRKRIGITMGDPAGIGPEVMLKGLGTMAGRGDLDRVTVIAYGTKSLIADAAHGLGIPLDLVGAEAAATWPQLRLVETEQAKAPIAIGAVSAEAGRLAFAAIEQAIRDAVARRIDAIVTGPISKEAINLAGYTYAG